MCWRFVSCGRCRFDWRKDGHLVVFSGLEQPSFYPNLVFSVNCLSALAACHYLHGFQNDYEFKSSGLERHICRLYLDGNYC